VTFPEKEKKKLTRSNNLIRKNVRLIDTTDTYRNEVTLLDICVDDKGGKKKMVLNFSLFDC
jgi:hypothetical protein